MVGKINNGLYSCFPCTLSHNTRPVPENNLDRLCEYGLTQRNFNLLARNNILHIKELVNMDDAALLNLRQIGIKGVANIRFALAKYEKNQAIK